ncbi:hypothetical protein NQZ68_036314 [Dissostichus eleginoides]|nr:hypothetical protein NQZ68_036314 [Dissostichus eleginoides]
MSDSDQDPFQEDADLSTICEIASTSSGGRRTSTRIASQTGSPSAETGFLLSQLEEQGISPTPGLPLPQLRELAALATSRLASRGRGRGGKSAYAEAPPAKKKTSLLANPPFPGSSAEQQPPDTSVITSLQSLAKSLHIIDARLQSLERASTSASSTITAAQSSMSLPGPSHFQPISLPQDCSFPGLSHFSPTPS